MNYSEKNKNIIDHFGEKNAKKVPFPRKRYHL
jgi:hypothetical protein